MTHSERDRQDQQRGVAFTIAERDDFRCQCKFGNVCLRRMTGEDFLCDWCRGLDHLQACRELSVAASPAMHPSWRLIP